MEEGQVKWFSVEKGYGFLRADGGESDVFFHASTYQGLEPLQRGDRVRFEVGVGRKGKPAASQVVFVARPANGPSKPYYGKPSQLADRPVTRVAARGALGAAVGAAMLGPFGALIGAVLMAGTPRDYQPVTRTCLRCGGTGHVTALTEQSIGFQCERCRGFWKERNRDGLKASDLEPLTGERQLEAKNGRSST